MKELKNIDNIGFVIKIKGKYLRVKRDGKLVALEPAFENIKFQKKVVSNKEYEKMVQAQVSQV